jgi:hypothetical protein
LSKILLVFGLGHILELFELGSVWELGVREGDGGEIVLPLVEGLHLGLQLLDVLGEVLEVGGVTGLRYAGGAVEDHWDQNI